MHEAKQKRSEAAGDKAAADKKTAEKEARLATALRANLRRRKAQSEGRRDDAGPDDEQSGTGTR